MPLYEYECEANSHRFEVIQKFSDPPIAVCPTCGSPVQKLPSSPAIQFKGSGFYLTDYGRAGSKGDSGNVAAGKSGGPPGSGDSSSKDKGESKGDGKSESKSDAKSDSKSETKSTTSSDSSAPATPAPKTSS